MKVNNLPNNYEKYGYLVVVENNGAWWFYGAWTSDRNGANEQALEVGGRVVRPYMVERGAC